MPDLPNEEREKRFVATGPNQGFSVRGVTGFYTEADKLAYGVNVQGSACGVYGESVNESSGRTALFEDGGIGVEGFGERFGVFGNGNRGIAGVFGENNRGRSGVIGTASLHAAGTGVVGLSLRSLGNPLSTLDSIPDPADGDGTGVLGSSGTGTGVKGSSSTGAGVSGHSVSGPGVKGSSTTGDGVFGEINLPGKSGVAGSNHLGTGVFGSSMQGIGVDGSSQSGVGVHGGSGENRGGVFESISAAQVQLVPHKPGKLIPDQPFPVRALNPKGHQTGLPANGRAGDLLCTSMEVQTGKPVAVLWFCVRDRDNLDPAIWRQVLLGPESRGQG